MKRFHALTDQEVLQLTDDELARHVDYECALAGAPLLPSEPGPVPQEPTMPPDLDLHEVAGLLLADRNVADEVAKLINSTSRYETKYVQGPGYITATNLVTRSAKVETARHISPAKWEEYKDAWETYRREYDAWKEARDEYRKAQGERAEIRGEIHDRRAELEKRDYERQQMERKLERYLELADGDKATALKFLQEAVPSAPQDFPELFTIPEPSEAQD